MFFTLILKIVDPILLESYVYEYGTLIVGCTAATVLSAFTTSITALSALVKVAV